MESVFRVPRPMSSSSASPPGIPRVYESQKAQLSARGLQRRPETNTAHSPVSFLPSEAYADPKISPETWAATAVDEVASATLRTGNHVCRSDVCHKGVTGRKGFCRMFFWHWVRAIGKKGKPIAQRCHGHELQSRWSGVGPPPVQANPPFTGLPALEVNHPFHFKMNAAMILGPRCNHDVGLLLRLPSHQYLQSGL